MTFAAITPALVVGAFAELIKFSSMLVFMAAWIIVGAVLTGVFQSASFGGVGINESISAQVGILLKSVIFTILYSGILAVIIFKVIDATPGMHVNDEDESVGLDLASYNERSYVI